MICETLGNPAGDLVCGEHDYEGRAPAAAGPGHVWVYETGGVPRCERCCMRRTWPGAAHPCEGNEHMAMPGRGQHRLSVEDRECLARWWQEGMRTQEIAARLGLSRRQVAERARRAGLKRPKGYVRSKSKLTREKAKAIADGYARGERRCDLAREFGVSTGAVHDVIAGRTWT